MFHGGLLITDNFFKLGLDSIRTAILNWHFLRIDTQEMHIPSAISILGTDLRGLIPWIIKLKQVKLRRNTEIQINMQIKLTCCCSCYWFFRSAKHGKLPKAVLRREPFLWEGVVRDRCILTIQNARNTCPSPHFPMNYVTHFFLIVSLPAVIRKGWRPRGLSRESTI